jgi:hypothetical protein
MGASMAAATVVVLVRVGMGAEVAALRVVTGVFVKVGAGNGVAMPCGAHATNIKNGRRRE